MSAIRRRIAVLLPVAVLAVSTAGCGEVREQSQAWREAPNGTSASAGDLDIRNALVVSDGDGGATVLASFANRGGVPDALTGVVVGGAEVGPDDEIALPAGDVVSVTPAGSRIDVPDFGVAPGRIVEIEFVFAEAPRVTVDAVVSANEGYYSDVDLSGGSDES